MSSLSWLRQQLEAHRLSPADVAVGLGLLVLAVAEIAVTTSLDRRVAVPAAVAMTLPLLWRRQAPVTVTGVVLGAFALEVLLGVPANAQLVALAIVLVACYSVGAYSERGPALRGLALALLLGAITVPAGPDPAPSDFGFVALVVGGSWGVGRFVRARSAHSRALEIRAAELAAASEERARQAAEAERRRIARELHDIVAHSISLMVVQAGGAEQILRTDPARAAESLRTIQHTGRQSLVEMKRLLGILREAETRDGLEPLPGIADLDALVDQVRAAGVPVDVTIEGVPGRAGSGVQLSVFRVVQEALTNVLKHADGAVVQITLRYGERDLYLDIVDRGGSSTSATSEPGRGLLGMKERAELFAGELEAGPHPDGGFRVSGRFPLEAGDHA